MSFISSTEIKTVTLKGWGYYQDNSYIKNSGVFVSGDDYWQIKGAIDVSYEASMGGSFQIGGMTLFEVNRTNVNFYSSETVDSSKRISTVLLSSRNQVVSVPSNAKIMILCVRNISPDESGTVTVTLRQQTTIWNTSDGMPPKAGMIYDDNGTIVHQIGKIYMFDGADVNPINKIYDYNGTTSSLIYTGETLIYEAGTLNTSLIGSVVGRNSGGAWYTFGASYWIGSAYHDPDINSWSHAIWWTGSKISMAGYTSLKLTATDRTGNPIIRIILNSGALPGATDNPQMASGTAGYWDMTKNGTLTVPLSSLQGNYHLAVDVTPNGSWHASGAQSVTKIWLE